MNDGIIAATNKSDIDMILTYLTREFSIKYPDLTHFLEFEINNNEDGSIFLHLIGYTRRILVLGSTHVLSFRSCLIYF